jgi:hypothetical protein
MEIPLEYDSNNRYQVCWLEKALYGLKQSSLAWFFTKSVMSLGFRQSHGSDVRYIIIFGDNDVDKHILKEN